MAQSKKKKTQNEEQLPENESLLKSASNDSGESVNMSEEAIKALIKSGRERGFVTHDELNKALPQGELTSEQIEDVMAELNSMGVNVVDNADQEDVVEDSEDSEETSASSSGNISDESRGSDDPVRMYLREMGTVELLTREGEIAIAKRIEAGRELMLGGVYESPLTIRALIQWRDEIEQGKVLMRDVIDLETTFSRINGEDSDALAIATDDDDSMLINRSGLAIKSVDDDDNDSEDEDEESNTDNAEGDEDDSEKDTSDGDGDDLNMSLAAMEDAIREDVMVMMEDVFVTYKELSQLRDKRITQFKKGATVNAKTEERYISLRLKLIEQMEHILLNTGRIEALMVQLYGLNKHLSSLEGQMLPVSVPVFRCVCVRPTGTAACGLPGWSAL